jgi:ABC-type sugar transport system ATPase subunit
MDEPSNNPGVLKQKKVLDIIRRLRNQRVPVILIAHILADMFTVSDRLMVMHRGRKVSEKMTLRHEYRRTRSVHDWSPNRHQRLRAQGTRDEVLHDQNDLAPNRFNDRKTR